MNPAPFTHEQALNAAELRKIHFTNMLIMRTEANTEGFDRAELLLEHDHCRKQLGGMFYAQMPTEKSSFVDTSKKSREIFVACPKCHRTLHESVVLYDGCYSCNR